MRRTAGPDTVAEPIVARCGNRCGLWPPFEASFASGQGMALLRCQSCSSGRLVPGTIVDRRALRCDRCGGVFLYLPEEPFPQARGHRGEPGLKEVASVAWSVGDVVFFVLDLFRHMH